MEAMHSQVGTKAPVQRGRWDEMTVRPVWDWQAGLQMLQAGAEVYCVQTPGTPVMAIQRSGPKLEIAWEGSEEFVLEVATSLKPGAAWTPVSEHPRRWADFNLVILEAGCGERFFRLRRGLV